MKEMSGNALVPNAWGSNLVILMQSCPRKLVVLYSWFSFSWFEFKKDSKDGKLSIQCNWQFLLEISRY